ncbi:MAG: hypothetical protein KC620_23590, partial [Myxococcales bacterium]|nr:hypothetical protein [Myxococcales bacterium]
MWCSPLSLQPRPRRWPATAFLALGVFGLAFVACEDTDAADPDDSVRVDVGGADGSADMAPVEADRAMLDAAADAEPDALIDAEPDAAPDAAPTGGCQGPAPEFGFDEVRRVILIADGLARTPSVRHGYASLLWQNDDDLFPAFAGHDLRTRLPDADFVRLDRAGAGYIAYGEDFEPLCVCGMPCALGPDCIDAADARPTLLILQLHGADLVQVMIALATGAPVEAIVDDLRRHVRAVLGHLDDRNWFARRPLLALGEFVGPTDGTGDLGPLAETLIAPQFADLLDPEATVALIEGASAMLAEETAACGGLFVETRP